MILNRARPEGIISTLQSNPRILQALIHLLAMRIPSLLHRSILCYVLGTKLFLEPWVMMIHKDNFVPVTHTIRIEMVGIPDSQVRVSSYYPSLGDGLEGNGSGELGRSHRFLSSSGSRPRFPRTSTSNTDSNHDNSGFCLVS